MTQTTPPSERKKLTIADFGLTEETLLRAHNKILQETVENLTKEIATLIQQRDALLRRKR
jgi:hypothetical protein